MGTFATTFAPVQNESEAEKIILDLIGLGFALAASPIWNSGNWTSCRRLTGD